VTDVVVRLEIQIPSLNTADGKLGENTTTGAMANANGKVHVAVLVAAIETVVCYSRFFTWLVPEEFWNIISTSSNVFGIPENVAAVVLYANILILLLPAS
jgi:hypothetical protein